MEIYRKLKERLEVKNDDRSKSLYKFHKNVIKVIRQFILLVFLVFLPFIETPKWCIESYKQKNENFSIVDPFHDC